MTLTFSHSNDSIQSDPSNTIDKIRRRRHLAVKNPRRSEQRSLAAEGARRTEESDENSPTRLSTSGLPLWSGYFAYLSSLRKGYSMRHRTDGKRSLHAVYSQLSEDTDLLSWHFGRSSRENIGPVCFLKNKKSLTSDWLRWDPRERDGGAIVSMNISEAFWLAEREMKLGRKGWARKSEAHSSAEYSLEEMSLPSSSVR